MKKKPAPARKKRPVRLTPGWFTLMLAVFAGYGALLMVRLAQSPVIQLPTLVPIGLFLAGCVVTAAVTRWIRPDMDGYAAAAALFLTGIGVVVQFRVASLGPAETPWTYWIALPAGWAGMLMVGMMFGGGRLDALKSWGPVFAAASLTLMAVVALAGHRFRGALFLPGRMNPAELLKLLLPLYAAAHLVHYREAWAKGPPLMPTPWFPAVFPFVLIWGAIMGLLVWQRDFGMIVLLNLTLLGMIAYAAGRPAYVGWGVALVVIAGVVAVRLADFHGAGRIAVWLDPYADETDRGWQILQGLTALYTGGLWGVGLGAGSPHLVPIASSDFIYAVIGEELGLAGCVLIVMVYLLLFRRGLAAASSSKDDFTRVLVTGLTLLLALQTLWNIGGVTKALPLTGVPLPFISQGGSSLLTCFLIMGFLLAASDSRGGTGPHGPGSGRPRWR